jgi:hypothetical protein
MKRTYLAVAVLLFTARLACSAPVAGVSQGWRYDPITRTGVMHLVNNSQKVVTTYVITGFSS